MTKDSGIHKATWNLGVWRNLAWKVLGSSLFPPDASATRTNHDSQHAQNLQGGRWRGINHLGYILIELALRPPKPCGRFLTLALFPSQPSLQQAGILGLFGSDGEKWPDGPRWSRRWAFYLSRRLALRARKTVGTGQSRIASSSALGKLLRLIPSGLNLHSLAVGFAVFYGARSGHRLAEQPAIYQHSTAPGRFAWVHGPRGLR